VKPKRGEPLAAQSIRLNEYADLLREKQAPELRNWVGHCDQIMRANNAMLDELEIESD
jgi:hypothetical protein